MWLTEYSLNRLVTRTRLHHVTGWVRRVGGVCLFDSLCPSQQSVSYVGTVFLG